MGAGLLLAAERVHTGEELHTPGWVLVDGTGVAEVGAGAPPRAAGPHLADRTVVPGFVDTHVHGGGGASFDGGDPEAAERAVLAHRAHGTTTVVASLVTDTLDGLVRSVRRLGPLVDDGLLAGVHLEGPWLNRRYAGAHDPALVRDPSPADVDRVLAECGDRLRMVTLAPELPGALDAVRRLTAAGVVVAIGHTGATYDQARAALDVGAKVGTHLFNAMRPFHHREPGPVAALLADPSAYVELIADGVHVHPAALRLAAAAACERTLLVTDAMSASAAVDGDYRLGRLEVTVRDGVARLASGAIAGSTSTLASSVRYAVQQAGLDLADAVRAATLTPARLHGLTGAGELRSGSPADLVVLDPDLRVDRVMHRGAWVG